MDAVEAVGVEAAFEPEPESAAEMNSEELMIC